MNKWKIGVYVHPDAVVASPDYARRLVEEGGVDHFVLRSGYDLTMPDTVEAAIAVIRDVKAQVCCLIGTWWGGKPVAHNYPYRSNEGENPMHMPGSDYDNGLVAKLDKLCGQYKPDALCLSHARHRHPAHIEGIYHDGDDDPAYLARMEAAGIPYAKVVEMRSAVEQAIGKMDKASLLKAAENGLIPFLGELAQNDIPKRLFAFRRETVREGYRRLEKVVRSHGVSFGTNAYPPFAVDATGQDYVDFEETCDFVQPLQSYIEFQRLMPIAAWGRYIGQLASLDDASAIAVSRTLLRLGDVACPDTVKELDTCGEGDDATIRSILEAEFEMLRQLLPKSYPILPVLRGKDWSRPVIDEFTAESIRLFGAYVLMGCDYLVPDVPAGSTGWF